MHSKRAFTVRSTQRLRLSVVFLEQLRVLSSPERKTAVALMVKAGENAKGAAIIADSVEGSFELFIRARALVTTVAYVSIAKPAWFGFEDSEFSARISCTS